MFERALTMLNGWIETFDLLSQGWRVAIGVFALVLCTAVVAFIVSRVIGSLERKFAKTRNRWDDTLLHAAQKPAVAFVWLQGVYWAAEVAHQHSDAEIFNVNETVLRLGFVWVLVWALLRLIKQSEKILVSPMKMKKPMDYTTVNAVSKFGRAVVIITAVLIAMQSLGYSISGVLAFGGVGGIAVGFAAKDLLANFFGGFIIQLDRPFKVGDWVRSPDRDIEGVVEHIGWRLTTLRTFDLRPLYVPNAAFTTIAVENPSRMKNRRIYETVGVRYADVSEVASIVSDIRKMLENHEEIDTDQTLIVNFLTFNSSSLDIMVYTFTKTVNWERFHEVKQDVLLKISEIIQDHGAEVAFPTRTLHVAEALRLENEKTAENDTADEADASDHDSDETRPKSKSKSAQSSKESRYGDTADAGEGE